MFELTQWDAPISQVTGASSDKDFSFWNGLERILTETPHSQFHLLNHWPVYTKRVSVTRFLAHYELFKMVMDVPGSIVELGVSRGLSLFTWHKLLEVFCPTDTYRKVVGFDSFKGLPEFDEKDGLARTAADGAAEKKVGGWSSHDVETELFDLASLHNADNILARERIRMVKGWVEDTLPLYLDQNPGTRISLLHLDMDVYAPTRFALDKLWDLVVPGGLVVFDEYGLPPWEGEAAAWEEFAAERGLTSLRIRKFPWALTPTGYVVKE